MSCLTTYVVFCATEHLLLAETRLRSIHTWTFSVRVVIQTSANSLLGELQVGTATFKPFQCLRYLALIEMTDKTFTSLPLDQDTLLQELATYRANEECQCLLVSEMQEAAVDRLVAYIEVQAST